jgi:hypothetical protein
VVPARQVAAGRRLTSALGSTRQQQKPPERMKKRNVTAEELAELERTLRWHFSRLHRELLEGPSALPDSHLAIAGHLRVLLCDHKYPPVLLTYARARGISLVVHTPRLPVSSGKSKVLVAWAALIASWEPVPDFKFVPVEAETYLNTLIGVVQYDVNAPSKAYTPREVINWVANTEGVSHFNFNRDKSPVHRKLKGLIDQEGVAMSDSELRKTLRQIGVWTLHAINHVVPPEPPLIYGVPSSGA